MPDGNDVCIVTEIILYQEEFYRHQPERREIKHSFFDLGGWPFKMKSLCCLSFSFSVAFLPITQCLFMGRPEAARFYNLDQDA